MTILGGAAGFISMHLCDSLTRAGRKVVGIDNLNDHYDVVRKINVQNAQLIQYIKTLEKRIGKWTKIIPTLKKKGGVNQMYADTSRLYSEIGTAPSIALKEGLVSLVDWVRKYYGY